MVDPQYRRVIHACGKTIYNYYQTMTNPWLLVNRLLVQLLTLIQAKYVSIDKINN